MDVPTTYREAMRQLKAEKDKCADCQKTLAEIAYWISEGHLEEQAAEMLKKAEDVLR